jgi:hypothetical protein
MIFRFLILMTFFGFTHPSYANPPKDKVEDKKIQLPEASKPAEATKKIEEKKNTKDLTLNEVSSYAESINSTAKAMTINFQEELYRDARKVTLFKTGYAYFIKPDMFRWEVSPAKQNNAKEVWIFDGKDLFQHNTKEKYATRYSSKLGKNQQLRELVDIIINFKALLSKYRFDGAKKEDELIHVKLTPKQKSEIVFLEITLQTTDKNKKIFMQGLTLHFEDKNRTHFKFEPPQESKEDKNRLSLGKDIKITNAFE